MQDAAHEAGIEKHIRFRHQVKRASCSTADARWTVDAEMGEAKTLVRISCNFLFMCSGYCSYEEGYTPDFPSIDKFAGRVVHPQTWTDDINYANELVLLVGSGATAVTLLPELAEIAAHVSVLQRSPT